MRSAEKARPARLEWERTGRSGPVAADGLRWWTGALSPGRATDLCGGLGLTDRDAELDSWNTCRHELDRRLDADGAISVEATVALDPPLFGRLRDVAFRDPALAGGLAAGTLTVRMGWRFNSDRSIAESDLLGLAIGEVAVPLAELPKWVRPLLETIGSRMGFCTWTDPSVAARFRRASLSWDPAERLRCRRALDVARDVYDLPLEIVGEDGLAVGAHLDPLVWHGPRGSRIARLLDAVFLREVDVLVVHDDLADDERSWLAETVSGPSATLEQVLEVG